MKNIYIFLFVLIIIITIIVYLLVKNKKRHDIIDYKLDKTMAEISSLKKERKILNLKIPRKIFQTIPSKDKILPQFQKNINYIKKLNPTWEYKLYDNREMYEYIKLHYPDLVIYFERINPKYGAARADFFRYLLMYREGGVYLDIKSAMAYPLDDLIYPNDEYILSHWGGLIGWPHANILKKYGEFQQWHIMCIQTHPALKAVIDKVVRNIDEYNVSIIGVGKIGVLKTTGPIPYTQSILPLLVKYNFRIARSNSEIGLIYNNIGVNHEILFGKDHYSHIRENVIIKDKDIKLNPLCVDTSFEGIQPDGEQGECSVAIEIAPRCENVLEIGSGSGKVSSFINRNLKDPAKHIVLDRCLSTPYTTHNNHIINKQKHNDKYTSISKLVTDLTILDVRDILPINCVISECEICLLTFFNSYIGNQVLNSAKIIVKIKERDSKYNEKIESILYNNDFVHTNTGYGCGIDCDTNIYTKI